MPSNPNKHQCEYIVAHYGSKPRQCRCFAKTIENGKFLCSNHNADSLITATPNINEPQTIKGLIAKKKNWIVNEAMKFYEERTNSNLNDLINALTQLRDLQALQRNTDELIPNVLNEKEP